MRNSGVGHRLCIEAGQRVEVTPNCR